MKKMCEVSERREPESQVKIQGELQPPLPQPAPAPACPGWNLAACSAGFKEFVVHPSSARLRARRRGVSLPGLECDFLTCERSRVPHPSNVSAINSSGQFEEEGLRARPEPSSMMRLISSSDLRGPSP